MDRQGAVRPRDNAWPGADDPDADLCAGAAGAAPGGTAEAAAHITGGGLPGNLPRVLPEDTVAVLEPCWSIPPVFAWLARTGGVAAGEMLRVFNCGIGMAIVVADAEAATELLRGQGENVTRIGHIAAGSGPAAVRIDLPPGWPG